MTLKNKYLLLRFNGAYRDKIPRIDQMAAEGMRFTHFLAAQPETEQ